MSGQPVTPARWRDEGSERQIAARARRRSVLLLFALLVGLVGIGLTIVEWIRPPSHCRFVPLFVRDYQDKNLPALAWREQDRQFLLEGSYFSSIADVGTALGQSGLLRELSALSSVPSSEALVVYLSAYARTDARGRVWVLPADCDVGDQATWLALEKILTLFADAGTRQKILILDLESPPLGEKRVVLLDDVWACVSHDLEAVPDPNRWLLCAASPNQRALASEALQHSGLAWYLVDGLRGRADTNGNGRINVRELGEYVRARVDRWSQKVRGKRQTPQLLGEARDFTLCELPNGEPRTAESPPPARKYPDSLQKAWEKCKKEQAPALVKAEQAWRQGEDESQIQQRVAEALTISPTTFTATPKPRSLAMALRDKPSSPDLVDALQQVVFQAGPKVRGLPEAKADATRTQLVDTFLKQQPKGSSAVTLAQAGLDLAIADPRPETLKLVAVLIQQLEPQPEFVETVTLLRVASLGLPPTLNQRLLEAVRGGEQAAAQPRLFPWIEPQLEAALQTRHEAMVLLQSRGYASLADAEAELAICSTRTSTVLGFQGVIDDALEARDRARSFLPQSLLYRERAGVVGPAWESAVKQSVKLTDRLEASRGKGMEKSLDDVRRQAALLHTQLDEISAPFTPENVSRLLRLAGGADADASLWRHLDGLLATSLVPLSQRENVWSVTNALALRLQDEVSRLDQLEGTKLNDVHEWMPHKVRSLEDRASLAVDLAQLAGGSAELRKASEALPERRAGLVSLEKELRRYWQTRTDPTSDTALWAWLADRYRYLARDYATLEASSPESTFYAKAAAEWRGWLRTPREQYAEIVETNDPPRLSPATPITPTFEVRANTIQPAKLEFRLFLPDPTWFAVSPTQVRLPAPGFTTTVDGGFLVPVRIAMQPNAGENSSTFPQGLLGRVRLNGDRAFHQLISIPMTPRSPQILLSLDAKSPTEPLGNLRLRKLPIQQTVFAYVSNPIDRVWNKLQVRLMAGSETRETAAFSLGSRAMQALKFPAGPPPAPAPAPTPTTGAAPPAPPALPALEGPLRFEVIDAEKNEVIARRSVGVDLADPIEYVSITRVRYDPTGGRNRLSVSMRLRRKLALPAVKAELSFPAVEDGGATYTTGTLKGTIPADLTELTLFADGISAKNNQTKFFVSVDGWARAFVFEVTLTDTGEVTPRQLFAPEIRPRVSPYALSSQNFTVPLETENAPPNSSVELTLGRLVAGKYQVEVSARRSTPRDREIGFSPHGSAGALVFATKLQDWTIKMDTTQIRGVRELRATLLDRTGKQLAMTPRTLVVSDQPPSLVRFINPPEKAWNKSPLALQARGSDSLAGVKAVNFFYGKPINDKPPPGTALVPGTSLDETKTLWGVKLPPAPEKKGPTEVSVEFVNPLGLSTFATTTVNLEENDPAKTAPGKISGKVVEGDRPQSGLTVYLTDDKRQEKGKFTTKDDGTFEFDNLPAGKYRLGVVKPSNNRIATYPRKGDEFIELAPGGDVTVELSLLLP